MRLLSPDLGVPVKLPKTLATVAVQLGLALLALLHAAPTSSTVSVTVANTINKAGTASIAGYDPATGKFYGISIANGHFITSTDLVTWTDRTYSPVTYTANDAGAQEFDETYMYATQPTTGRLWRAPKDVFNNWTEISVPDRGPLTNTRPGSLSALGGGVLLFGNYTSGPGDGAHIWRSTDAGATWSHVLDIPAGKHVHAIREAPNGVVWASIGDAGFTGTGLWKSTDNGVTWTQMSTNDYGIDMVFTPETASMPALVVLEGDGYFRPHLLAFPQDGQPGDETIPLVWYSGAPSDGGTARGIGITPNNDIIYWITTQSGAVGTKAGLYVVPAPYYQNPILLADNTGAEPPGYSRTYISGTTSQLYTWTFTTPTFAT